MTTATADVEKESKSALGTCHEIVRLSLAQRDAIELEDVDRLNDLISKRELLISSLDLGALQAHPNTAGSGAASDCSSDARSSIIAQLREAHRIDQENQDMLQARLSQMHSRLIEMNQGRQGLRGYACLKPLAEPAFIDRRR
ncbi:MAG: hypothetical protein M1358_01135 [Chloroflexi bacterium]|nr:hypothetical protein [Chloroflexota bacterium]